MVCGLDADGNRQLFPAEILGILRNVGVIEMGIELASLFQDLFAFIGLTVIDHNHFVGRIVLGQPERQVLTQRL